MANKVKPMQCSLPYYKWRYFIDTFKSNNFPKSARQDYVNGNEKHIETLSKFNELMELYIYNKNLSIKQGKVESELDKDTFRKVENYIRNHRETWLYEYVVAIKKGTFKPEDIVKNAELMNTVSVSFINILYSIRYGR